MIKILEFLIKFIAQTHLDDHIEVTHEPSDNPDIIIIRRIIDPDDLE